MVIDHARISGLLDGSLEPENRHEELLIMAFEHAQKEGLLMRFMIDNADELDYCGVEELAMINLGYAIGQHDLHQQESELMGLKEDEDGNGSTFH